jgi:hypothetical protein
MVLWCKVCNALLGLRMPYSDWTTDRTGFCPSCAAEVRGLANLNVQKPEGQQAVPNPENLPDDQHDRQNLV